MYKIIGGDQKEYGPVNADELRKWISEGRLNARSLVQALDNGQWKPLSEYPELADALGARVAEPTPDTTAVQPLNLEAWTADIRAREPQVRIGECISNSVRLVSANFGLFLGACAIVWGIGFCSTLPLLDLVYRVMAGVLYGGLYLIFLKRIRGEPAIAGEVFAGFNLAFVQLMLAGFLIFFLSFLGFCACIIPGIYLSLAWVFGVPLVADKRLEFWSAMELSRTVVTKVWFEMLALVLLVFLPTIAAGVYFGSKVSLKIIPLFQQAFGGTPPDISRLMENLLRLKVTNFSLSFSSRLVLLFNLPFALAALMYAYENLFGSRTKAAS